ncbi:MAG: hypothetical protein KC729_12630, partial [Candidatus Eisenbacteria bacterium]|nr:hypothetical protein [Candidatus Eisenbacteria bacterium]
PAFAQETTTTVVDLGLIGFNTLATVAPSLYYRPIDHFSARSDAVGLGMGGANLARLSGPLSVSWSPAGLASVSALAVSVDGGVRKGSSSTSGYPTGLTIPQAPPLFVTSYNVSQASAPRYGAIAAAVPIWSNSTQRLVGALSWRRYNVTAAPESAVLDLVLEQGGAIPVTIAKERTERGAVEAVGPSLALRLLPGVDVGANANFLTGRLRASTSIDVNTGGGGGVVPGSQRFTNTYRGLALDIGGRAAIGDRIAVAATFSPSYTLEVTGGEFSTQSVGAPGAETVRIVAKVAGYDLEVPSALSVGGEIKATDRLRIAVDYDAQKMADAKVSYNGPVPFDTPNPHLPLDDGTSFHVGAEYVLFRPSWAEIPIRFGFRSTTIPYAQVDSSDYTYVYSYQNPNLTPEERRAITTFETAGILYDGTPSGSAPDGTGFSFGISLRADRIRYDLGAEFFNYKTHQFYFDSAWDPVLNPNPIEGTRRVVDDNGDYLPPTRVHPNMINVDRTVSTFRLSATYTFPDFF